jgi:transcriptional regulator with XRE-family HTH domain
MLAASESQYPETCICKYGTVRFDGSAAPGNRTMAVRTLASQLRYVEEAHDALGLTYRQLAAAIGADESTLHRWRSGESEPRSIFLSRMDALHEFQQELLDVVPPGKAREWLRTSVPVLDGRRPVDLLEEGRIETLTRLLMRMNLGTST